MRAPGRSEQFGGLVLAVASSAVVVPSGPLARALVDTGWTPGSAVTVRTGGAFAVLLGPALVALSGRTHLLRGQAPWIVAFGVLAVAGSQLCYFNAVARVPAAVALLVASW